MQKKTNNMHWLIPLAYFALGSLWILFSDVLLFGEKVTPELVSLSTLKGFGFIFVTTVLLYALLRQQYKRHLAHHAAILQQSEFHRAITRASPLAIYSLTPEGNVITWNESAERIFGWTREETVDAFLPVVPQQEMENFQQIRKRILAGEAFSALEVTRVKKDGTPVPVSLSTAPIRDSTGNTVAMMVVAEDISDRKEAARTIHKLNRLYLVLSNINQTIVRVRDLKQLYHEVCRVIVEDGKFTMAWLGVVDESSNTLTPVASAGKVGHYLDSLRIELDTLPPAGPTGPPGEDAARSLTAVESAFLTGEHAIVDNVADDERIEHRREEALEMGYRSYAAFPLIACGQVMGVFCLYSNETAFFDASETRLLDELAMDISLAMEIAEEERLRKKAEWSLMESESRYRSMFEYNLVIMMLIDPKNGNIVDANPAACAFYGWSREAFRKLSVWELDDRDPEEIEGSLNKARTLGKNHFLLPHRLADGTLRNVEVFSGPIRQGDKEILYAMIFDVTDRLDAEAALVEAKEHAETANRTKSEFLANMSHELRTPLNGIAGMLQVMLTTDLNSDQKEYAQVAINSTKRLTVLLSDVLDLSRLEAGRMTAAKLPFDLKKLLSDVEELFKPHIMQNNVTFNLEIAPELPGAVSGDSARLFQVLANLVGNAFKFTEEGSVTLHAAPLPPSASGSHRVLLTIMDTGIGIPEDKIDELFEPFTQANEGFTRQFQGAGLGLAICRRLTALMGGSISMTSEVGKGTTVCVSLPLERAPETTVAPPVVAPPSGKNSRDDKLRLLLAEDDMVNRIAMTKILEKSGCNVMAVEDGSQALELLQRHDFDAVFMDIQMPVMDGVEATRHIREGAAGEDNSDMPVVAITSYAMAGDKERFLAMGLDHYIAKPVDRDLLLHILRDIAQSTGKTN